MTDEEPVTETALDRSPRTENHTELSRLAARIIANIPAEGSSGDSDSDMSVMLAEKFSGPFAHPAVLFELNKVLDNGAERAFCLTEKEQQHRHELEKKELDSEIASRKSESADRRLVILLVFVFLTLCLAGAFAAIMTNHATGAGLVGGAGAIISAAALLIARSRTKKNPQ